MRGRRGMRRTMIQKMIRKGGRGPVAMARMMGRKGAVAATTRPMNPMAMKMRMRQRGKARMMMKK